MPSPSSDVRTTRARNVIFATYRYTKALLPALAPAIMPVRGTASQLVVPEERRRPISRSSCPSCTYNLHYSLGSVDYLIPRPDDTIVLGGGENTLGDDRGQWWDNFDDEHLIEEVRRTSMGACKLCITAGRTPGPIWGGCGWASRDSMLHFGAVPGRRGLRTAIHYILTVKYELYPFSWVWIMHLH